MCPDQLFGLVCDLILKATAFEEPKELLAYLTGALRQRFAERGEDVIATVLPAVRDFQEFLWQLGRVLHNAFSNRNGIEAPHAFSFKKGALLSGAEPQGVKDLEVNSRGVYCCVKTYMRDRHLQDPPVLVIPAGRQLASLVPGTIVPPAPLSKEEAVTYAKLIAKCSECDMVRAAGALQALMHQNEGTLLHLHWLLECEEVPLVTRPAGGNPFFGHLPERSFQLVAGDRPAGRRWPRR